MQVCIGDEIRMKVEKKLGKRNNVCIIRKRREGMKMVTVKQGTEIVCIFR